MKVALGKLSALTEVPAHFVKSKRLREWVVSYFCVGLRN